MTPAERAELKRVAEELVHQGEDSAPKFDALDILALLADVERLERALRPFAEFDMCPCCGSEKGTHDEECTFKDDDPSDYRKLMNQWEEAKAARAALGGE